MNGTSHFVKSVTLNFSPLLPTTPVCLPHMHMGGRFWSNCRVILLYMLALTSQQHTKTNYVNWAKGPCDWEELPKNWTKLSSNPFCKSCRIRKLIRICNIQRFHPLQNPSHCTHPCTVCEKKGRPEFFHCLFACLCGTKWLMAIVLLLIIINCL